MSDFDLKSWLITQIEGHGLGELAFAVAIIGGAFAAVGYVVGWRVTIRKAQGEIEKIKVEGRKAAGENFEKLAKLRQVSNQKRETLNLAMGNMRDAILTQAKVEHLRNCRDEMCNLYASDYLPALGDYVEMIPTLVGKQECLHRAKTELVPGLQTMCSFLEMVNVKVLMEKIPGSSRLLIRREVRDGILDRIYALVPWYRFGVKRRLISIRERTDHYLRS
jgi:hypothetical protein